jgi:hypothetical protein
MNKEEIFEILDELVARLEGPAVQVYELAFGANLRGAILFVSIGLVLILVGAASFTFAVFNERRAKAEAAKLLADGKHNYYDRRGFQESSVTANAVGSISLGIGLIMTMLATYDLLTVGWRTLQQIVPGL